MGLLLYFVLPLFLLESWKIWMKVSEFGDGWKWCWMRFKMEWRMRWWKYWGRNFRVD